MDFLEIQFTDITSLNVHTTAPVAVLPVRKCSNGNSETALTARKRDNTGV